jgi:hypothetical protein
MNWSGRRIEAVLVLGGLTAAMLADAGLTAVDVGKEASIRLLRSLAHKTALFEMSVEVHRAAVRAGAQSGSGGQCREGLKNFHHRLRRFKSTRVHVD